MKHQVDLSSPQSPAGRAPTLLNRIVGARPAGDVLNQKNTPEYCANASSLNQQNDLNAKPGAGHHFIYVFVLALPNSGPGLGCVITTTKRIGHRFQQLLLFSTLALIIDYD
jgi:hypothetical protein